MEPFISIATWEGEKLQLWAPFQNPFVMRNLIAKGLGIAPSNIRLYHQLEIGGAFGGKLDSKLPFIAALLRVGPRALTSSIPEEERWMWQLWASLH